MGSRDHVPDLELSWTMYVRSAEREYERSKLRAPGRYPHYSEDGGWVLLDVDDLSRWEDHGYEHGNWTAGFWFGVMWLASIGGADREVGALAMSRLSELDVRANDYTTHDLGFLFYPALSLPERLGLVSLDQAAPALDAARMLTRRFNHRGRFIQAFGPVAEKRSAGTSTIDTMMNLPLLWWAHEVTGEPTFLQVGREHARTTARTLIRPNGSAVHLAVFDPHDGAFLQESTLQGASPDSAWTRGQGWAVCGFAWAYAVVPEPEFLAVAERAADYFASQFDDRQLPPWDFADSSRDAPRDASALAAMALGCLILEGVHPDAAKRTSYGADALRYLGLAGLAINDEETTEGILLQSSYSVPTGRGVGGATAWGDFYLGLALSVARGTISLDALIGSRLSGSPVSPSAEPRHEGSSA